MDETLKDLGAYIAATRGDDVVEWHVAVGELTVTVVAAEILPFDPTARFVDYLERRLAALARLY